MNHCGRPECACQKRCCDNCMVTANGIPVECDDDSCECHKKCCCAGKYPALEHHSEKSCWTEKPSGAGGDGTVYESIEDYRRATDKPIQEKAVKNGYIGEFLGYYSPYPETKKPPTEGAASGPIKSDTESVPQDDDWDEERCHCEWAGPLEHTWCDYCRSFLKSAPPQDDGEWEMRFRSQFVEKNGWMLARAEQPVEFMISFIRNLLEQAEKEGEITGIAKYRQAFLDSVRENVTIKERARIEDAVGKLRNDLHGRPECELCWNAALDAVLKIIRDEK